MTVDTPDKEWTDARIGDLSKKVDEGFEKVDQRFEKVDATFRDVRKQMQAGFAKADEKLDTKIGEVRGEMKAGFDRLDDKFDKKYDRLMWAVVVAGSGAFPALVKWGASLVDQLS
jgi:hypothetical protein